MNLSKKTILVTGASRGIGKAIATALGKEWTNLVLVGRNTKLLRTLAKDLPGQHTIISADLTQNRDLKKIERVIKRKRIILDGIINNAGIGIYKPFERISTKDWDNSYLLNVKAPYFLTQYLLPHVRKSQDSIVINIGSCSALQSRKERTIYNSTKSALRTTTLCLAKEYENRTPHFCVITLDSTLTSFGPLTVEEKENIKKKGKYYLDPSWVAEQIVDIIKAEYKEAEYVFSPDCYDQCGTWVKP